MHPKPEHLHLKSLEELNSPPVFTPVLGRNTKGSTGARLALPETACEELVRLEQVGRDGRNGQAGIPEAGRQGHQEN